MSAVSEKQRRFVGAELSRKRAGKKTATSMSESQLRDFAKKRKGGKRGMPMQRGAGMKGKKRAKKKGNPY